MTDPTSLSLAAKTVLDAWNAKLNPEPDGLTYLTHDPEREALAAALRAAVDQVVPGDGSRRANEIRSEFLAIVTELENPQ